HHMPKERYDRLELLRGTLDMLILRTLRFGPAHGHQISKHIRRTTDDVPQVEHGYLRSGSPRARILSANSNTTGSQRLERSSWWRRNRGGSNWPAQSREACGAGRHRDSAWHASRLDPIVMLRHE